MLINPTAQNLPIEQINLTNKYNQNSYWYVTTKNLLLPPEKQTDNIFLTIPKAKHLL
jgi:hypothetical protein